MDKEKTHNKICKVAIISGAPRSTAPFIDFYIKVAESCSTEYILLNVEKPKSNDGNTIYFPIEYKPGFFNQIVRSFRGFIFIIKILKVNKCKKLILTPTRTGMKLLFYLLVFKRKKYIVDIRDLTKEKSKLFRFFQYILIKNSYATFLSSRGFSKIIKATTNTYYLHNFNFSNKKFFKTEFFKTGAIKITSAGMIAYPKVNFELMKQLLNTNYELHYYGVRTTEWDKFFKHKKNYNNLFFHGKFDDSKKHECYKNADFINGIYDSLEINPQYLLPNRLYDSAIYRIPIIVSDHSYVGDVVKKYGLGIVVDIRRDNIIRVIENYISDFDETYFNQQCEIFLEDVYKEQKNSIEVIINFLNS